MKRSLISLALYCSSLTIWASEQPDDNPPLPLEELRAFTQVFEQIRSGYVEEVSDQELFRAAIRGMLSELDPHSTYLENDDYVDLQQDSDGSYGGLGIEISDTGEYISVVSPIDDTPASKAGLRTGDRIIEIDGQTTHNMTSSEAAKRMRGEIGEAVTLTVSTKGQPARSLELIRAAVPITSVRHRMLDSEIGYLRISQFQRRTTSQARDAISALKTDGAKAIVIDVRNNPGGLIKAAVDIVDMFIGDEIVVTTKGRHPSAEMSYRSTPTVSAPDMPIVVLINEGSASASEIVAGALQDYDRAIILGTRSFGKGSVQTLLPISDTRAIKLTTARYFTPKGHSIQAKGITPDIYVERARIESVQPRDLYTTEADLDGHLASNNLEESNREHRKAFNNETTAILERDNQLFDAVTAAKSVLFTRKSEK